LKAAEKLAIFFIFEKEKKLKNRFSLKINRMEKDYNKCYKKEKDTWMQVVRKKKENTVEAAYCDH
jgi:hypothetical protein